MRVPAIVFVVMLVSTSAQAEGPVCQEFVTANVLPPTFKFISSSAVGPAKLVVMSNEHRVCNNVPAMQRRVGQAEPDGLNWACSLTDADETKAH